MVRGKRVLLVENDPTLGMALTTLLRRRGGAVAVELVASYGRAVRRLSESPLPDVLISDFDLIDGRTGIDLALWCRQQPAVSALPRLIYSGAERSAIAAALAATTPDVALDDLVLAVLPKSGGVEGFVAALAAAAERIAANV